MIKKRNFNIWKIGNTPNQCSMYRQIDFIKICYAHWLTTLWKDLHWLGSLLATYLFEQGQHKNSIFYTLTDCHSNFQFPISMKEKNWVFSCCFLHFQWCFIHSQLFSINYGFREKNIHQSTAIADLFTRIVMHR